MIPARLLSSRQRRVLGYTALSFSFAVLIAAYAVWAQWSRRETPDMLKVVEGLTDELGRAVPADHPRIRFVDASAEAGIDFAHFSGERRHLLPEDMGSGAAWGDYDADGDPDLFVVNFAGPLDTPAAERAGRPNALYRNEGGGRFREVAAEAGVAVRGLFMGAYFGDHDNDGWVDLFLTGHGETRFYRNLRNGRFEDRTAASGLADARWSTGAAWGDLDRDGWLDLYVCRYVDFRRDLALDGRSTGQYGYNIPFTLNPATYDPLPNSYYRNNHDGTFTDLAGKLAVADPEGRSLAVALADLDFDDDLDIYVADDVSKNALFRNRGDGSFEEWSAQSLAADYRGAMGLAVGDYDEDDDLDLFITHWIAQENALYQNSLKGVPATGQLLMFDVADQVGVGAPGLDRVSWGTSFLDHDNDGRLDLFVVNGHTFEDPADPRRLLPQRPQLFWNRHPDGFFDTSTVAGPALHKAVVGRGAAFADYDLDGDVDVFVTVNGGPAQLLRNDGGNARPSIGLTLHGTRSNREGLGAVLRLTAGGKTRVAQVGSQGTYLSWNSPQVLFGLGAQEQADSLEVRWPSGQVDRFGTIAARRHYRIEEGGAIELVGSYR